MSDPELRIVLEAAQLSETSRGGLNQTGNSYEQTFSSTEIFSLANDKSKVSFSNASICMIRKKDARNPMIPTQKIADTAP